MPPLAARQPGKRGPAGRGNAERQAGEMALAGIAGRAGLRDGQPPAGHRFGGFADPLSVAGY
jgi:hypothetical protein